MKPHRILKNPRTKSRPFGGKCEGCGKPATLSEVYIYVDLNNAAITAGSPYLCRECYEVRYPKWVGVNNAKNK